MKVYKGYHIQDNLPMDAANEARVLVEDGEKEPRVLVMSELAQRKSPTGFSWGYAGSGPAALAHSILFDCLGRDVADDFYQQFKFAVIGKLEQGKPWTLTETQIREWFDDQD